jgi:glycosyltransferase involved in cell wall biosynthesis
MNPLVSIIIPCYNQGKYVPEAILSAYRQMYEPVEIIVINDGSTDNSNDRIIPYLDRITYINQTNQGVSAARNNGLDVAQGKYCLFLDADDMLTNDYVGIMVREAKQLTNPVISAPVQYFGLHSQLWRPSLPQLPDFLQTNCTSVTSLCLTAQAKKIRFDETMRSGYEDWDFWIRMWQDSCEFSIVQEPLRLFYRRTGNTVNVQAMNNHQTLVTQLQEKYRGNISK